MTNELNVDVKIDVENEQDLDRLNDDLGKTADSAGRLGDVGTGVFQGIGQSIGNLAIGFAQAGISAAIDAVGESISLASDRAEASSKAQVLFGDSYAHVAEQAENAATTVGVSSGEYLTLAGNVGNLVTNFGFAGDEAAHMSTDIVQLAADVGSFNNAPTADVVEAIGAAFRGETEPIRKYGVMLNQAAIEAKAVELGLWDGVGAIDASAKASATYQLILEGTSAAQGDFARTSDGLANGQKIANARIEESLTDLGDVLMPIVQEVLPLFADALTTVIDVGTDVAGVLIDVLGPPLGALLDVLADLWQQLEGPVSAALDAVGFLFGVVASAVGLLGDAVRAVSDVFGTVTGALSGTVTGLDELKVKFSEAASEAGLSGDQIERAWADAEEGIRSGTFHSEADLLRVIDANRGLSVSTDELTKDLSANWLANEGAVRGFADAIVESTDESVTNGRLLGMRTSDAVAKAIADGKINVADDAREMMRFAGQAAAAQANADALALGRAVPGDIADGMIERSREVLDAGDRLIELLKNGLSPEEQAMRLIGAKYTTAVAQGIRSEIPGAKESALQLAITAINTVEDAGLEGAAGVKGMAAIGRYYDLLLAGGMTSDQARVALAAGGVADATINALDNARVRGEFNSAGDHVASAWVAGFGQAIRDAQGNLHHIIRDSTDGLHGASPPRTGPLRHIDTWGENIGRAWLDGLSQGASGRPLGRVLSGLDAGAQLRGIGPLGLRAVGSPGDRPPVVVNVYAGVGDPVAIGREVAEALRAYERASGTEA